MRTAPAEKRLGRPLDAVLVERIRKLIKDHPTYGYRKLWALLRYGEGLLVNLKAVYRILKAKRWFVHQRSVTPRPRVQGRRSVAPSSSPLAMSPRMRSREACEMTGPRPTPSSRAAWDGAGRVRSALPSWVRLRPPAMKALATAPDGSTSTAAAVPSLFSPSAAIGPSAPWRRRSRGCSTPWAWTDRTSSFSASGSNRVRGCLGLGPMASTGTSVTPPDGAAQIGKAAPPDALNFMIWVSTVPVLPLLALSLLLGWVAFVALLAAIPMYTDAVNQQRLSRELSGGSASRPAYGFHYRYVGGSGPGAPGPGSGAPGPGQMAPPAETAPAEAAPNQPPSGKQYPRNLDHPTSASGGGPGGGGPGGGGPDNVIGPRYQNLADGPRVRVHDIGPEWLRNLPERTGPVIDFYRPVVPYFDPRFRFAPRIGPAGYGGGGGGGGYGPGGGSGDLARIGAPLKFEKLPELLPEIVVYVSAGNDGERAGKIYQLDDAGRVLGIVNLPYHATGLALHRQHGLIAVTPRDGGKVYRIDETGAVSVVLENNSRLPYPVDVGVGGDSDTIVVADSMADVLAATSIEGTEPIVYRRFENVKYEQQDMSVAVTRDKHVIYGTDAEEGIYRFGGDDYTAFRGPILPGRGGVAADPATLRWAATQSPNLIHLYEGELHLKTFKLSAGRSIYRQGLLSFAPSGAIVVATRPSDEVDTGVWLMAYETAEGKEGQILSLFPWDKERMLDLVVGPRMLWDRHSPSPKSRY